jgi:protein-S-isoprenylcysteine O-methyltransferase Ste14
MSRATAAIVSAIFFIVAPGFAAGVVPWWISGWHRRRSLGWPLEALGILLIAVGAIVLINCFGRFALQGLGTPAPILPTRHLVVTGLYRHVRNPMYVGVLAVILGQALVVGNAAVFAYAGIVWLGFHLFVLAYEEPTLKATYNGEYEEFCSNVPRWLPRLTPWQQNERQRLK